MAGVGEVREGNSGAQVYLCLLYYLDYSPGLVLRWRGKCSSRVIPIEVNMPLPMVMLLDWNPTGPGKGDVGMV